MVHSPRKLGNRILPVLASFAVVLAAAGSAGADDAKYLLQSKCQTGHLVRVKAGLDVGGSVILVDDGKSIELPMSVVAQISYDERLLEWSPEPKGVRRSIRQYEPLQATIKIDKGGTQPALRDERRFVGVSAKDGETTFFSPKGP